MPGMIPPIDIRVETKLPVSSPVGSPMSSWGRADPSGYIVHQFRRVSGLMELGQDDLDMAVVAGFHHDVDIGHLDRDIVEQAAVIDLDDVAPSVAQELRHLRQRARSIG